MNGSRHEAKSSVATSTENHLDTKKLSNPEQENKINGSQVGESIKVPNIEPEKKINGSQVDESIKVPILEPEKKINGSQVHESIKVPTNVDNSSVNAGSLETVHTDNKSSTGRRLLEDNNSKGAEQGASDSSKEDIHASTVENDEALEADADSSFELFRNSEELADEYSYDYDDYVDETMWGDEEWTEVKHDKLEDHVNVDSHILCTPVSSCFTFVLL